MSTGVPVTQLFDLRRRIVSETRWQTAMNCEGDGRGVRQPLSHGHACLLIWRRPSLPEVNDGNQPAIRAFFAGLDEEARDLAERLAHGDDESVWAWFERRYPKATKRAASGRHWREFVTAIREFYGDDTRLH